MALMLGGKPLRARELFEWPGLKKWAAAHSPLVA
jgi:hypothetical protein